MPCPVFSVWIVVVILRMSLYFCCVAIFHFFFLLCWTICVPVVYFFPFYCNQIHKDTKSQKIVTTNVCLLNTEIIILISVHYTRMPNMYSFSSFAFTLSFTYQAWNLLRHAAQGTRSVWFWVTHATVRTAVTLDAFCCIHAPRTQTKNI